ncbi:MAG TPA: Eco57I restriction-modification methylase domain-containing protein [Bacteroidales bacterium]|nr:Eco57I restriction-modification methylase domain-containing protein [Bacteroidales bacterium]
MEIRILKPRKALNKAFLKVKPNRTEIEHFKTNLSSLLDKINDNETEEFHKNLVSDFLKDTYYKQNHFINTKGRNDLVIHNGQDANSTVGVIIEAKKPINKSEMITTTKLNTKAFQELVLYYMRERITYKNLEIKHLIATNINEWFIFDEHIFERHFAHNKSFVKQFENFEASKKTTDVFYKEIAEPFIDSIISEIEYTYFNIQDYQKTLRNADKTDDNSLIALFKILSPEHLLKLPFANDSNSLDKRFYSELLHIIGLTETKDGSKKIIERNKAGERNTGSLLENAIIQLDSLDKISHLEKPNHFGKNKEEQLFNIALELSITWINRILFLKLLEAQLGSYHKDDKSYEFLKIEKIKDYDALNSLFFQVLAKRQEERNEDVKNCFSKIPYLNSSLFEPTKIEQATFFISQLNDDKTIPICASTVLKDETGKKCNGHMNTLAYLFAFLNAYDFASEGSEEIQEENKTLINASVLGLIFEKINGYKDGSFFTPGFITMYMCRETIRNAVIQKFNKSKGWNCHDFNSLYDKIENRNEANNIINQIKICDPAVGSGHFLVSALNEIIAIKSDLKILQDREGRRLKEYHVEVVNDELIITDEDGKLFEYNPTNKESRRIQECLFHEKQTIIENCLFGVDLNPNSVKICRLRLWIELLKNAYYKNETELETLPNIDINIKCGNSLISRFSLDSDLRQALKKSKWNIDSYRIAVATYRNAENKEQKREMERLIATIKSDFRSEISSNDPKVIRLKKLQGELIKMTTQGQLFELSADEKEDWKIKMTKLTSEIQKLEAQIEEIKNNKIYENAFEWRFEFPEVLDDNGDFVGFDVVIGNPPYYSLSADSILSQLADKYTTYTSTGDIYALFIELSQQLLAKHAIATFIISNKWMRANYGQVLRKYIIENTNPVELIDFGQNLLFENAIVHTCIISLLKQKNQQALKGIRLPDNYFNNNNIHFNNYIKAHTIYPLTVDEGIWNIVKPSIERIKIKAEKSGKIIKDWKINFRRGLLTGLNEAFIIDDKTKERIIADEANNQKFIKPILRGRDTRKYYADFKNLWILNIPKGYTIKTNQGDDSIVMEPVPRYGFMEFDQAWAFFSHMHKDVAMHLLPFKEKAEKREDQGDFWWELRACSYIAEFEKPKIIFSEIVSEPQFFYDEEGYYPEATVFFMSGEKLKYLTALLNSKCVTFLFKTFYMGGELVGKIRYKKAFLEQVPIPYPTESQEMEVSTLVDAIISQKEQSPYSDISKLEKQIDQLVYKLYDLTEEEIGIIENSVK